jgi:alpha-tubulin suppressor-like RCC1 family protein
MGLLRALALLAIGTGCAESIEVLTPPDAGTLSEGGANTGLAGGAERACAIKSGVLWCWGDDRELTEIEGLGGVTTVTASDREICALEDSGEIACFESIGDVPQILSSTHAFSALSGKYAHHCAITRRSELYCWGENEEGQLGQDDLYPGTGSSIPLRVGQNADWTALSAGQGHTCGIRAPGTMWCWGRNSDDHLGQGSGSPIQIRRPVQVGRETDWTAVDVSQEHSCGLRDGGELWCWGNNEFGALGVGRIMRVSTPKLIMDGRTFVEITTNTFHSCGRDQLDFVHCSGRNAEGQLAAGDILDREFFTETSTTKFATVAAGRFFTCAQREDQSVQCSGENNRGQLGLSDRARRDRFTPQP